MKIKYVFASGKETETEVSEELGSFITDSRREESNSDRRRRYHCISLDAIDYEGTEFGTPDFSDEILDELDNRKERKYEAFSHLTEIQQRRLTMLASGLSEREIARREKVNIRAVVESFGLEEGMRLNTSIVKQLCSTDTIFAEKKYKDPFSFVPTHTLVLYTNHLPKVGASDSGTWRRLVVIPFNAKIEKSTDKKNYASILFENAGEYVLKWIIEGAQLIIGRD